MTILKVLCWVTVAALMASPGAAAVLGTGFTYQGQLNQGGTPVNGTAHLQVSLWDSPGSGSPPVGGNQIGTQYLGYIPVTNGLFTVQVNESGQFGLLAFNGEARWLQIEVCADAGCGTRTPLSPRQPLTATPYSRYSAGPWQTSGSNLYFPGGNVGIGTALPQGPLDVRSSESSYFRMDATYGDLHFNGGTDGVFGLYNDNVAAGRTEIIGQGIARLVVVNSGNVGVGTNAPAAKLDVRGDVKLGTSGQYFAPAGEEKLRIVRGVIDANGNIIVGYGFTVTHPITGVYQITLSPAFAGPPSITATMDANSGFGHAMINTASASFTTILLRSEDGSYQNAPFHFIAIGPR